MMRFIRSAFVIARRDFTATVLSKAFIFFLLGPLFPLLLGGVFGGIGAQVASRTERPTVAVAMTQSDSGRVAQARDRLADGIGDASVVRLIYIPLKQGQTADPERLLKNGGLHAQAVLSGSLDNAELAGSLSAEDSLAQQVHWLLDSAKSPTVRTTHLVVKQIATPPEAALGPARAQTAQIGQMLLFFLTLLLSGMLMSQLIEEKSNKIVEVIAAAVPIDAMFVGKLFAMLASSIVGIVVWISAGALLIQMIKTGGVQTLPPPAVGWPAFLVLGVLYFAMNYLLLGSVFLTIGAQASTAREVQTLSMPVTFGQVLLFGFAATAIGAPDSGKALAAAAFPLSSPMVMLARAAERPEIWPHFVAMLWQALWVALILRIGAHLFRKTVLKSGPRRGLFRRRSAA